MRELAYVNRDKSDVVLLRQRGRLPSVYLSEHLLQQLSGWPRLILANHFFELPIAEEFSTGILRLDQSIRVQQKPLSCADRELTNGILGIRKNSKQ